MNKYQKAFEDVTACNCRDCTCDEVKLIEELIERAAPKKVTVDTKHNTHCPVCGEIQVFGYYNVNNKYCPHCGQSLDWSDEE